MTLSLRVFWNSKGFGVVDVGVIAVWESGSVSLAQVVNFGCGVVCLEAVGRLMFAHMGLYLVICLKDLFCVLM